MDIISKIKNNPYTLILSLVFIVVYCFTFDTKPDINGDNATYISLAQNLSKGLGYVNMGVNGITPASHFPPGYSAFLSVFMLLGIESIIFFKVLSGLCLLASLLLIFYATSKLVDRRLAFTACVLCCLSPKLIDFSYMVMSEMPYLLLTTLCFFGLYKYSYTIPTENKFWKSPYFFLAVVSAALSYYFRTIGVSAMFAVLVFFAFRKEWRIVLAAAGSFFILLLPWSIRNAMVGVESRYLGTVMTVNPWRPEAGSISSVGEMIDKMLTNFDDTVIKGFKILLFPFTSADFATASSLFGVLLGLVILAVVVYGLWNMGSMRYYLLAFFAANIGVFMLWHGGNQVRYVIPIVPFIFIAFWVGVYKLISLKSSINPLILCLLAVFMISPIEELSKSSKAPYPAGYNSYSLMLKSLDKFAPAGSVICCRKPEFLSLYTKGMKGTNYKYTLDDSLLIKDLIAKNVDFVILDNIGFSSTPRYLYPAIQKNKELFPVVHIMRSPDTYLMKFDREKAIELFGEE